MRVKRSSCNVHLQTQSFPIIPNRQSRSAIFGRGALLGTVGPSERGGDVYLVRGVAGFRPPGVGFRNFVKRADRGRSIDESAGSQEGATQMKLKKMMVALRLDALSAAPAACG